MISSKAKIGKDVEIHPLAYIEENAEIGDNTQIGPFCIVRKNAKIGKWYSQIVSYDALNRV